MDVTKKEFVLAYNEFPPNKWTKFMFKYFSTSTDDKDSWLSRRFAGIEITLFMLGLIGTVLDMNKIIIGIITLIFLSLLIPLVLSSFTAKIMNNIRIKKIRKKLGGISMKEYDKLVDKYSKYI
jgi:hypothetical protein